MRVFEIFSCSGGMAEGFRRAGLPVTMAVDYDDDACASYERNMGHTPLRIDVRELLRLARAGWLPLGGVDLIVADPPCTPWSRAGKRLGQDDERDMLADTVELVRLLRPRAYLIANVPGLDDAPNAPVVQRTIGSLAREGYCTRDFARLDAADFGVPQHRIRPFWYGHRGGACLTWPIRTHAAPADCGPVLLGERLRPWVTCRDALSHLSAEDLGSPIRLRWRSCKGSQIASVPDEPARVVGTSSLSDGNVIANASEAFKGPDHRPSTLDAPAKSLTRNTHSDGALLLHDRHPINRPDEPSFTITSKGDGRGAQGSCAIAWPWERPATTVTARAGLAEPGHHVGSNMSTPNAIKLSEKAAAILQGFPDGWHFVGKTKRSRWSQIGMAMPPPLAESVARSIARAMIGAVRAEAKS